MPDLPSLDAATAAIVVAVSGIILWFVTQVHLLRVARAIKSDIDVKREATEAFVHHELGMVKEDMNTRMDTFEGLMGKFEGRMTAQMPPNVDGRIEELETKIQTRMDTMDEALAGVLDRFSTEIQRQLDNLPKVIEMTIKGRQGIGEEALMKEAEAMGTDIEGIAASNIERRYIESGENPAYMELMRFVRKPVSPELEERNPWGAMGLKIAKAYMGEFVSDLMQDTRRAGSRRALPAKKKPGGTPSPYG